MPRVMREVALQLDDVHKTYRTGNLSVPVLHGISLSVKKGEFMSIMGPSGSGKSTLMHIIGALDVPTSGKVIVDGEDISRLDEDQLAEVRGKRIGFVFQKFNLIPSLSAAENVELPLLLQDVPAAERARRVSEMLGLVGLHHRLGHRPGELSGGEQQRVAIARALVNNPAIILADEPTGNLDSKTGHEIIAIFRDLHSQGRTIVFVTHDASIAGHSERIVRIKDGRLEGEDK